MNHFQKIQSVFGSAKVIKNPFIDLVKLFFAKSSYMVKMFGKKGPKMIKYTFLKSP